MSPFKRNVVIRSAEDVKRLAGLLSQCPQVTRFDEGQHKEAWALADSFAELESSFRAVLDEQFPKLLQESLSASEINKLLMDIGYDFSQILYHILEQPKFYKYLVPEESGQPRE